MSAHFGQSSCAAAGHDAASDRGVSPLNRHDAASGGGSSPLDRCVQPGRGTPSLGELAFPARASTCYPQMSDSCAQVAKNPRCAVDFAARWQRSRVVQYAMAGALRTGFAREPLTWSFAKGFVAGGTDSRDSARFDAAFRHVSAIDPRNPLHSGTSVPAPRARAAVAPCGKRVTRPLPCPTCAAFP